MEKDEMHTLINKYLDGEASPAEAVLVEEWYQSFEKNSALTEQMNEEERKQAMHAGFLSVKAALGLT
jgi:hypothetical protein